MRDPNLESIPPNCICCECMNRCIGDPQKPDYCPDNNYRIWLDKSKETK